MKESKVKKTNTVKETTKKKREAKIKKVKKRKRLNPIKYMYEAGLGIVNESDKWIFYMVIALLCFGIVMVFSAGYYSTLATTRNPYQFLVKQGIFGILGIFLLLFFSNFDYHRLAKHYWIIAFISIFLLFLLMTPLGVTVNFATRWIVFFGIRITPSEISKLAMIIFTAAFLAEKPVRARKFSGGISVVLFVLGVHAVLIIKQPNLSTAIVIGAIMMGIMFVGGLSMWYVGTAFGTVGAGMIFILLFLHNTHWYSRLTNFMNPFKDAQGESYQVAQSVIALGNGGLKGLGLGKSVAKNLYLPEPQNDFILAIIGEELGFIGVFLLMAVYLLLFWRCILVSSKAKDKLGLFMASGVSIMLGLQVVINVAVVTSSMPATGITLPFVSYGGTSLWVFMAAMGIILNISRQGER